MYVWKRHSINFCSKIDLRVIRCWVSILMLCNNFKCIIEISIEKEMISTAVCISFENSLICHFYFGVVWFGKVLTWQWDSWAHIFVIVRCNEWLGVGEKRKSLYPFCHTIFSLSGQISATHIMQQGNKLNYFLLNTS